MYIPDGPLRISAPDARTIPLITSVIKRVGVGVAVGRGVGVAVAGGVGVSVGGGVDVAVSFPESAPAGVVETGSSGDAVGDCKVGRAGLFTIIGIKIASGVFVPPLLFEPLSIGLTVGVTVVESEIAVGSAVEERVLAAPPPAMTIGTNCWSTVDVVCNSKVASGETDSEGENVTVVVTRAALVVKPGTGDVALGELSTGVSVSKVRATSAA